MFEPFVHCLHSHRYEELMVIAVVDVIAHGEGFHDALQMWSSLAGCIDMYRLCHAPEDII